MGLNHNASIVTDGLVLCLDAANKRSYPGSGTVWNDLGTNKNNGTLTNGPTFNAANGGSIVFDGTDDYCTHGALPGSFASFTVIVWFYPTSVINYRNVIDCNYNAYVNTWNIGPRLEMNVDGNLGWIYSNITSNNIFYAHTVINTGLLANKWHYTAITYNGTNNTSISYYNGVNTGISRILSGSPTGFINSMNNVTVGTGWQGGAGRTLVGRVAIVNIYNRSLDANEILQNYNTTRGRFV